VPFLGTITCSQSCRTVVLALGAQTGRRDGQALSPGTGLIYVPDGEGRIEEVGKPPMDVKPGLTGAASEFIF
jgi:hypothetical protein